MLLLIIRDTRFGRKVSNNNGMVKNAFRYLLLNARDLAICTMQLAHLEPEWLFDPNCVVALRKQGKGCLSSTAVRQKPMYIMAARQASRLVSKSVWSNMTQQTTGWNMIRTVRDPICVLGHPSRRS
jgi:hypothetical protein